MGRRGRAAETVVAACLLAACRGAPAAMPPSERVPAAELQPHERGWQWTYAGTLEGRAFTATQDLLAIEQRWIPQWARSVPTPNAYLSLDGRTHVDKSLLPVRAGELHLAREGLFHASWDYEPPLSLFGGIRVGEGDTWEWRGELRLRRQGTPFTGPSSAKLRAEAWEWVRVPAGRFRCLRTRIRHDEPPFELVRWHCPAVGLIRAQGSLGGTRFYEASLLRWRTPGSPADS